MTIEADSKILLVDDEDTFREALARSLATLGYQVSEADDGETALDNLRADKELELALLDLNLPGLSGLDLLPEMLELQPRLGVVVLSGINDATTAARCMQRGALDYVTKPVDLTELGRVLNRAKRRRQAVGRDQSDVVTLRRELDLREAELALQQSRIEDVTVATLEALVNVMEAKDRFLPGHSARVASLAASIAHELQLSDEAIEEVRAAGRLHDLGMIGIRESVLSKRGGLTEEEFEHVRQHVVIGSEILAPLKYLGSIVEFVRGHHERWDGLGYPDGLSGTAIPLGARVLAAAEIYDALTTPRPYQGKRSSSDAVTEIQEIAGTVLDPDVASALTTVITKRDSLIFIREDVDAVEHHRPSG